MDRACAASQMLLWWFSLALAPWSRDVDFFAWNSIESCCASSFYHPASPNLSCPFLWRTLGGLEVSKEVAARAEAPDTPSALCQACSRGRWNLPKEFEYSISINCVPLCLFGDNGIWDEIIAYLGLVQLYKHKFQTKGTTRGDLKRGQATISSHNSLSKKLQLLQRAKALFPWDALSCFISKIFILLSTWKQSWCQVSFTTEKKCVGHSNRFWNFQ